MAFTAGIHFAMKHTLHTLKQGLANERFVVVSKALASFSDPNDTDVKRIVEKGCESIFSHPASIPIAKSRMI